MIEMFNSILEWIEANSEAIVGTLSSLNLGGISATLVYLFKQRKTIVDNTNASTTLTASADELNKATHEVAINTKEVKALNEEVTRLRDDNGKLAEIVEQSMRKVDVIIEILNVVYGTLKDETVRTAVQNIVLNAKYSENTIRKQLEEEIAELKAKIEADAELLKNQANDTFEKVNDIVNNSNNVNTRY